MKYTAKCISCGVTFEGCYRYRCSQKKVACSARCAGIASRVSDGRAAVTVLRDTLIRSLMPCATDSMIAALLGTSRSVIEQRRRKLGLIHKQPPFLPWTEPEKRLIEDLAPCMSNEELAELLGRPPRSVERCVRRLGVVRPPLYYIERGMAFHAYPPELQEVIRLHNKVKRALKNEEHRRSA